MLAEIFELKMRARRRLPKAVFDFLEGGAGSERDLSRNGQALNDKIFKPKRLVDVSNIDPTAVLLNTTATAPFFVAPTGMNGILWPSGDLALSRAAARAGIPFVLSTASTSSMEEVVAASSGQNWFQIFPLSPSIMESLISRAEKAGIDVLVLTVDVPVNGDRRRDKRNKFQLPFKPSAAFCFDLLRRPKWVFDIMRTGAPTLSHMNGENVSASERMGLLSRTMDASFSWKDIGDLRKRWKGRLLVKGLCRADDVNQCRELGVDGVVISNHGGRQLDDSGAPVDLLHNLQSSTGFDIFVDGGFTSGADIAKALALGATGVGVGRAVLYGLAADGENGAYTVIEALKADFTKTLTLLGCPAATMLNADLIGEE